MFLWGSPFECCRSSFIFPHRHYLTSVSLSFVGNTSEPLSRTCHPHTSNHQAPSHSPCQPSPPSTTPITPAVCPKHTHTHTDTHDPQHTHTHLTFLPRLPHPQPRILQCISAGVWLVPVGSAARSSWPHPASVIVSHRAPPAIIAGLLKSRHYPLWSGFACMCIMVIKSVCVCV